MIIIKEIIAKTENYETYQYTYYSFNEATVRNYFKPIEIRGLQK
jgi:hypothetical protein